MLKLFSVVLGGRADGCHVELHDVVFVVGQSLEETYPDLISNWFGNKKRLHIDSSIELKYIDGHEVVISDKTPQTDKKIFFVNFGGYRPNHFGEIHETGFYVASSKSEVLTRAKKDLCLFHLESHCDDNLLLDDVISINKIGKNYIHLLPSKNDSPLIIDSYYRKLSITDS